MARHAVELLDDWLLKLQDWVEGTKGTKLFGKQKQLTLYTIHYEVKNLQGIATHLGKAAEDIKTLAKKLETDFSHKDADRTFTAEEMSKLDRELRNLREIVNRQIK